MRKKTTIAWLLAALVFLPLLFSGGLQLFQFYLKHRAAFRLENEQLVSLSIPLHKVKWMEEGREIMVDGKMFDLKTFSEKDGLLLATGVYDERETRVMEWLNEFSDAKQTRFIINLLLLVQTMAATILFLQATGIRRMALKYHRRLMALRPSPFLMSFYPPPR